MLAPKVLIVAGHEGTPTPIEGLEPVDAEPRLLRSDRDFADQLGVSANSDADAERRPAA